MTEKASTQPANARPIAEVIRVTSYLPAPKQQATCQAIVRQFPRALSGHCEAEARPSLRARAGDRGRNDGSRLRRRRRIPPQYGRRARVRRWDGALGGSVLLSDAAPGGARVLGRVLLARQSTG